MSEATVRHGLLDGLVTPETIAIVGASPANGVARNVVAWNRALGSSARLVPVHPSNADFMGIPAVRSLADATARPDIVAIALGTDRARGAIEEASSLGIPAVVVYSDLRGAFTSAAEMHRWEDEIRAAGTAIVGPNCMGYLSTARRASLYSGEVNSFAQRTGDVGLISHSGAIVIGLLAAAPRLRFSHAFSSGNETAVGLADYLAFLAQDPDTSCIGLFLESIRDPAAFDVAMAMAHDQGKPVVALCVGKSARARENVATHSGALAPEHRVMSAFLSDRGVVEVDSFQELTETLVAMRSPRRPRGHRSGMVHLSGGEASLQLDLSASGPLDFPPLSAKSKAQLATQAPWLAEADNPLDAWGPPSFADNFRHCLAALAVDDDIDFVIANQGVAQWICDSGPVVGAEVARAVAEFTSKCTKPVVMLSNLSLGIDGPLNAILEGANVALLSGDAAGIKAIENCVLFDGKVGGPRVERPASGRKRAAYRAGDVPAGAAGALTEVESAALLSAAGMLMPLASTAASCDEAVLAAGRIGFPVVLKASSPTLTHKSDVGAVITGIEDVAAIERAFRQIASRVGESPEVTYLVVQQVQRHRELLVGAHRDPTFGLVMVVGLGGVMAEVLDDSAIAYPQLTRAQADRLIDGLRCRPWLDAWRHLDEADLPALVDFIVSFSNWLDRNREVIDSVDVNPIAVLERGQGCLFLDALIVRRTTEIVEGNVDV